MDINERISLSLFGYNRTQAKHIIQEQKQTIHTLEDKVTALEEKIEGLNEELDVFKTMQEALTKGIIDARQKGDEIISEADRKADHLLKQTNEQMIEYKDEFAYYSRELVANGTSLKDELKQMKSKMQAMLESYQEVIDKMNFDDIFPSKDVDRLLSQVDAYEYDDLLYPHTSERGAKQESTLTDNEKRELQALIQDVIYQEQDNHLKSNQKLVNFKSVNQ